MEWISVLDKLPPNCQIVLGWGLPRNSQDDFKSFYLCSIDYEQGWLEWPELEPVHITHWMLIDGPNGEHERIYVECEKE